MSNWRDEKAALLEVLDGTGLVQERKWGKPCYTHEGTNIVIVQSFKDFLALLFFKGALMNDPHGLLEEQGENTRSALRMTFRSVQEVADRADVVRDYVAEAVQKKDGVIERDDTLVLVPELAARIAEDAEFAAGFRSLTPGRQRAYNLQIGGAKQSTTRARRVDRYAEQIKAGKGLRD